LVNAHYGCVEVGDFYIYVSEAILNHDKRKQTQAINITIAEKDTGWIQQGLDWKVPLPNLSPLAKKMKAKRLSRIKS